LKLWAFLVLCTFSSLNVEFNILNEPTLPSLSGLDFLLDLVLLGDETVAFLHLPL
jgi:hypothetical protein